MEDEPLIPHDECVAHAREGTHRRLAAALLPHHARNGTPAPKDQMIQSSAV